MPVLSVRAPGGGALLERPQDLILRLGLGLALAGGFGLGLYLLLGFTRWLPLPAQTPALVQAHGAVQVLGFVPLYVLAVGTILFPKFHASPLDRPRQVSIGGVLLASGVAMRALAQPAPIGIWRSVTLVAGALLMLGGLLLAFEALGRVARRGQDQKRGRVLLVATVGVALLGVAVLNLWIAFVLAGGAQLVPTGLDEAFLHFALWGFGATMILVVGGRVFEALLLLRPERRWLTRPMQAAWLVGVVGGAAAWLLAPDQLGIRALAGGFQLVGAAAFVACHRLFEPPRSKSRLSATTSVQRWARIAFGFLLLGAGLNVLLPLGAALEGIAPSMTAISAARHALAQGFLVPVMVFMGARTLPGFSVSMLRHPRLLEGIMAALFSGAALRVVGELIGGYSAGWNLVVALGAVLTTGGFTAFAIGVLLTMPPTRAAARVGPFAKPLISDTART